VKPASRPQFASVEQPFGCRRARARGAGVSRVARELGLGPEPTGTGPVHWQARCPGTNHPLYIQAATGMFGCGWCKRKGGEAELREFVAERRAGTKA
jgi:hypothetical protein